MWIVPKVDPPNMGATGWMLRPIGWTAAHVFHASPDYLRLNTGSGDKTVDWKAQFTFQQPSPDVLVLDGEMNGHKVHMDTRLFDRSKFLLVSRGFNWVQERPFNR